VAQRVKDGPLVLWASQTGNAEDFAARLAGQLGGSQLINMDDMQLAELAAVRDVLVITSTFGDGGPPDNGAGFWDRLHSADAPALGGVRYAVLGIGDRSYANFCGNAKAIDGRFAALGATRMLERTECEAYDDAPMDRWAERVTALLGAPVEPGATNGRVSTLARATTVAEPFTRAKPLLAPLSRNVVLTAPTSRKEVRQFGFDISECDVSYAVGDSMGVYATNDPATVDAWLAATGLRGDTSVEVDGNEQSLRDALIVSYDICRVTSNLLSFVAESCRDKAAAKTLMTPKDKLDKWLVNRNGLDVVQEFAVRADPEQ
jgi:sulfite reductase alpha subunit-like flavoprotein